MQMEKAQAQFTRWQQLSKGNPDRKRLEGEIDDECRSIAWQARVKCAVGTSRSVHHVRLGNYGSASGDAGG